ncbi:MAG: NTP transferase domain-containing protein [Amphiplicatus sp.]
MKDADIAAALLAAGSASRFGSDKLAALLGRKTLLHHSAAALAAGLPLRAAVLRASSRIHAPLLERYGYHILMNEAPDEGLSASLRCALAWAQAQKARAALIALADMPFVTPAHYSRLVEKFRGSASGVAYSVCDGRRSPPAIFSQALFAALEALKGDVGARTLLESARAIDGVEAAAPTLDDIDSPKDLSP